MKKLILAPLVVLTLGLTSLGIFNHNQPEKVDGEFAPKGMVAYAASYSSDPTNEPQYSTQNNKTFQYLNLGKTHDFYRGDSVKVGIIDSGINYDHEDFMVNETTKVKGDSKYYAYQTSSWVYYKASQHGYSYIDDTLGHGTNVAATVAAAINSVGGTGLAPNVELYIYKVTNSSNGYEFGAIQNALMDAQTLGIDVINMSFQSYEHDVSYGSSSMAASTGCSTIMSYYLNQAYNAGITLVGAAGNYNTNEPSYPGSNNHVINVGSLDQTGTEKAGFSNYGSTIDLVAPGYVHVADKGTNTSYKDTSGTSFSAPLVTAAIALYIQQNPSATPAQIESALYASCDPIDDSSSPYTNWAGNGALNVAKFLGCDVEDAPTEIVINNAEVVNEELELEIGDYLDLDWVVNGVGTFDDSVNFYTLSGEDNVVSVNSSGRITATGVGSDYVVIESNADSSVYASVYVTVTSSGSSSPTVSSVTVSPSNLSLDLNGTKTATLSATVSGNNNPEQTVTWSSSNTSVATVSAVGLVTAKATGSATITAKSTVDQTKSGTCSVTVTDSTVHVSSVSLNKASTTITKGDNETFVATVLPNNATNKSVTWSSSNTSAATVNSSGVVSVPSGATTGATSKITVTTVDGSKTAECTVTVGAPNEQTLTITRSSFATSGGYAWYDWTQATSDNTSITGKAELYTTTTTSMQFNKGANSSNKVAAIFNTTAIPGSITKIEAQTASGTNRAWNAYVASTAYSASGSTLTSGSNATKINSSAVTITTSLTQIGTSNAGYSYFCIQENVNSASYISQFKITYTPKSLSSISVKTAPTTTSYEAGDYFDPTGLVITKTFTDNTTQDVSYASDSASFTFTPELTTRLATSDISVTIVYGGKSTSQAITVTAAKTLSYISISGQTTSFVEGDAFLFGGSVIAYYSDSSSDNVTGSATFSGYNMTTLGSQNITVSYTYKGTTKTTDYSITIAKGTLQSISVSGQTTTYMKNNAFSFDGTCTANFENGYQKIVNPTSVSSPDMSTAGNKTVTVSFTYNGVTQSTTYQITVNSNRTVIEKTETTGYSEIGTITFTTEAVISSNRLSINTGGYTTYENNTIRLGSGSNTGSITVTSTTSNITKIVVNAKSYGSDTGVHLTIGGTDNTITSSNADYVKEYSTATNSCAIATTANKKRAHINSITVYETKTTCVETDISNTEDCVGLESFIDTYMHMNYVDNLGYCSDSEHHYYSTAKTAFNNLNTHQRSLFTSNSAYLTEWTRLSTWASKNGESLNSSNLLAANQKVSFINIKKTNNVGIIVILGIVGVASIGGYFVIRRRKED